MGLTSSLYTGLSGLTANSQLISVAGNNIANVNTNGFKASRTAFETQISQLLSTGSAPTGTLGGTNPTQIGMGVRLGAISRNFNTGTIQPTGVNTDLGIEGNGFFALDFDGITRYSRAGNFSLDRNFDLVLRGGKLQGYGVDGDFQVLEGVLQDVNVPVGALTLAEATRTVQLGGNLNAGGDAATVGAIITTNELHSAAGSASGANQASAATALTSLYETGTATALFTSGDVITVSGITKGGATLPGHTFEVGAANTTGADDNGTTLQDWMDFLQGVLGIDATAGIGPGLTVSAGQIVINGNTGGRNDLTVDSGNVVKNRSTTPSQPFTFNKSQSADGESVRTTFVAFDSLGNQLSVDLSVVLEGKSTTGTQWRYYAQSDDDSRVTRVLGNGTLTFDTSGRLTASTGTGVTIQRDGTGAATPQVITLAFEGQQGAISALSDVSSQVAALSQDGSPIGTLEDFTVGDDGTITGVFSNSLLRSLGRVVLATFTNPQGLIESGANLFTQSVNSGEAQIFSPGSGGTGRLIGGAVELSNADLSQEFINLITASTGFTASSRVLTTSDRLLQELLVTLR